MKNIIFDTDLGGDCDDVMALDLLLAAERAGDIRLLGVTYSADVATAPACIYAILKQHGREDIPIGRAPIPEGVKTRSDCYATKVAAAFPDPAAPTYDTAPSAVSLLRRLLAENDDVTLIATGPMTNMAALITSAPDEASPLDGVALTARKVCEIAVMGCGFSHLSGIRPMPHQIRPDGSLVPQTEWNILLDIPAARTMFDMSPVPIAVSPFELGYGMITGAPMRKHGNGLVPDSMCYTIHGSMEGRDSWDPATALYGVYGAAPWFYRSVSGKVTIAENGNSDFIPDPQGLHTILACAQSQEEIAAEIDRRVMTLFN